MMKLYYSDVLSGRKACAVAAYLKAPVEYIYLDFKKGEHRAPAHVALNPNGKVPTLVDGERVLWEADAVICYLSDRMNSELWPRDDAKRIEIISWFSWNSQHFLRAGGALYFEYIIRQRFGLGPADASDVEGALTEWRRFAAVLDKHLEKREWLVGDALSVADFSVAVALPYASQAHIPLEEFASVRRWHDQLNRIPAWREPFPK